MRSRVVVRSAAPQLRRGVLAPHSPPAPLTLGCGHTVFNPCCFAAGGLREGSDATHAPHSLAWPHRSLGLRLPRRDWMVRHFQLPPKHSRPVRSLRSVACTPLRSCGAAEPRLSVAGGATVVGPGSAVLALLLR